ncbi:MAG: cation:proton antiporter [Pseudomonadota bacterium]
MDFQWVAIAFGDVAWISVAFVLGLVARSVGLPPLVGFLATGFLLNAYGIVSGEMLEKLSDLGITLLLFTVGLKLNLATLARPQVWAVTALHMSVVTVLLAVSLLGIAGIGGGLLAGMDLRAAALLGFALSFSSTVFVVKVLEERGEMYSLHGRIAIGILIMQDIAAVVFLALSSGTWPSPWALLIVLLFPLKPIFHRVLERVGHGELLVLYGFLLAMGGAELFELVQLKGDLGALVLGVLVAAHPKADELAKTMLSFKDLFLLGFFLSIGLSGPLTLEAVIAGLLLVPVVMLKSTLFCMLLTAFRLRARTVLLATVNLSNFSEFGLIVASIGAASGWIDRQWLIVIAVALAFSFAVAALLNANVQTLYTRHRRFWKQLQRSDLMPDDRHLDTGGATIVVIGMGGVGTGAYDTIQKTHGDTVLGVDIDAITAANQRNAGRNVLQGDPSDADFWDRMRAAHSLKLVMLALPKLTTNLAVLDQLRAAGFAGQVAATAKFDDEVEALLQRGADTVFNVYNEAGAGFAGHTAAQLQIEPGLKPRR